MGCLYQISTVFILHDSYNSKDTNFFFFAVPKLYVKKQERKTRERKWDGRYGISSVTCPGKVIVMTPPHMHMRVDILLSAGIFPSKTVGEPTIHGATVTGMQGIGVNTPIAAAVAAATIGLDGVMQTPNGMTFIKGAKSMMFAAGTLLVMVRLIGKTASVDGATPKLHIIIAPIAVCIPMLSSG